MSNADDGLPTAAEAEFCETCGLIETVIPIQNFTREDKQPCEDNQMKDIELVRRSDHQEDKLAALKFALEAYDRDDRSLLKEKYEELLDEVDSDVE